MTLEQRTLDRRARSLAPALLTLAGACAQPSAPTSPGTSAESAPAPAETEPEAGGAAPETTPITSAWQHPDALPPGAIRRLGSRELLGGYAAVAITDDGTLWLPDDPDGIVAIDRDGRRRIIDERPCSVEPRESVAVGGEVRFACTEALVHVSDGRVTRHALPARTSSCAWAQDGESVACIVDVPEPPRPESCGGCTAFDRRLVLFDSKATMRWELPGDYDEVREVLLGRGGAVVLRHDATTEMFRDGKRLWSVASGRDDAQWVGLSASGEELVSFHDRDAQWVKRAIETGREVGRSPKQNYSVYRDVTAVPGTSMVYVALAHPEDASPLGSWRRAIVDPATGKVTQAWRWLPYEWGSGVSSNGQLAASIWHGFLFRVALDGSRVDRTAEYVLPALLAASPESDRLAVVGSLPSSDGLVLYDVETGRQLARTSAPAFHRGVSFSPDASRVAVSAKFGELAVVDGRTGATRCTSEDAAGSWIRWHGNRLVTLFPGDNGDDCDEITPASVVLLDDACKVVKRHDVHGVIEVIDDTPSRLVISAARWKHECGDHFELLPAEAWSIDTHSGAKTVLPAEVARRHEAKRRAKGPSDDEIELVPEEHRSLDGQTRLVIDQSSDDRRRLVVRCVDTTTRATLASHVLPRTAREPMQIAPGGEWFATTDAASVLLYPCRPNASAEPTGAKR
jgi:hemin uptake protein HemP